MTIIVDEHEAADAQPRRSSSCHSECAHRSERGTENIRYKKRGVAEFLCTLCESNPGRTRRSACTYNTETKSSFGHTTILSFSSSFLSGLNEQAKFLICEVVDSPRLLALRDTPCVLKQGCRGSFALWSSCIVKVRTSRAETQVIHSCYPIAGISQAVASSPGHRGRPTVRRS